MARKHGPVVVTRKGGSWPVKQDGQTLSVHRTQHAANAAAKREAVKDGVERLTQGRDHRWISKDSFGNESKVKDREH